MSKRLCFGGSFNPIHYGHLRCAEAACHQGKYDSVILIPSARPPHKPNSADLADADHRLKMCELATAEFPGFEVNDIEVRRAGKSYTIDTARELKAKGWSEVHWLIGADMLNYLPRWHRALELIEEVHFVIVARPGFSFDWNQMPRDFQALKNHVIEAPLVNISATEIRRRVRAGLPIDDLTPSGVARYIAESELYI